MYCLFRQYFSLSLFWFTFNVIITHYCHALHNPILQRMEIIDGVQFHTSNQSELDKIYPFHTKLSLDSSWILSSNATQSTFLNIKIQIPSNPSQMETDMLLSLTCNDQSNYPTLFHIQSNHYGILSDCLPTLTPTDIHNFIIEKFSITNGNGDLILTIMDDHHSKDSPIFILTNSSSKYSYSTSCQYNNNIASFTNSGCDLTLSSQFNVKSFMVSIYKKESLRQPNKPYLSSSTNRKLLQYASSWTDQNTTIVTPTAGMAIGIHNNIIYYMGGKASTRQFVSVDPNDPASVPAIVSGSSFTFDTTNNGQYYTQYGDLVYMLIDEAGTNYFKTFNLEAQFLSEPTDYIYTQYTVSDGGCVAVDGTFIYLVGGNDPAAGDLSTLQMYDIAGQTWTDGRPSMLRTRRYPACLITINTKELFVKYII